MPTAIRKTTFTFTVLHREDAPLADIEDVLREASDGHAVGAVADVHSTNLPTEAVRAQLLALGNDGTFFDDDED